MKGKRMAKKPEQIVEETQRESIINRPHNLAGSVKRIKKERFNISSDAINFEESTTVPALIKLFMEALDNPIDVAIKGGCSEIDIKVDKNTISIKDNGYGVSTLTDDNGESVVYKAFCKYNTSSNYGANRGQGQKGVNGIGVKLCTTLSTKFVVESEDVNGRVKLEATENNLNHKITKMKPTGSTGVSVKFSPDFKIFDVDHIDDDHIKRMFEYTLIQALTYKDIKFKFNGKRVSYTDKQFISLLDENYVIENNEDYFFAILPNKYDDFKQMSFVNGLETSKGGTHVDYIMYRVVNGIREKLVKKYKNIKPGDIRNKLTFVLVSKNVKQIDWDGQTKESITTPDRVWSQYFKDVDFEKLVWKIQRKKEIIDPITEVYRIKEEYKKRQELKGLKKTQKKIKSEKYYPSIGTKKYLLLTEGQSATGGLMPALGRKECGYYELKGKPLNAYSAPQSKFTSNTELSELFQIIQNENYEYIVYATDQDLDGFHIRGLLTGFIQRYLPEWRGRVCILQTPVIAVSKNNKMVRWYYNLSDDIKLKHGESSDYKKGLGSWDSDLLKQVVKADGVHKMINIIEFNNDKVIDDWMGPDSEPRKKYILANDFSIAKL